MKNISNRTSFLAKLALFVVAILWGTSLTVVKSAADIFKPNFLLGIRFTIAGIILATIFHKKLLNARKDELGAGIIIGIFLFISYSSQTLGVTFTTPGRSGFLSASYCVIVPFLYWVTNKVKPDKFNISAAIFCIVGIFFIAMAGESGSIFESDITALYGDGLALLSGFLFACHIVSVTKLGVGKDPFVLTIMQFLVAGVLSWVVTFVFEDNKGMILSTRPMLEVLYLAVMCTAVALLLQNLGQKYTDPSSAAIILGCESIFGVILPVAIGIESLTVKSVIGFVLIFIAIIISETKLSFLFNKKKTKE
ncbi:MAG: DMT family transporter [Peptoniphilaceae bacterium]|uniref:DMT family transporter n=1 Tax=Parvimonas sp. TaxID=1944660 RepID=UPI0025D28B28|nr:DMT family transporter [Parvimonas sp.]MCI5996798.1 DMT family transporter [Parvimonas sp.]MDD7764817.1 DMT family transporter [Peptoniphilaceae bacterium]MDY3050851.1 DMT family transporter [Parvimonas sp.]